MSTSNGKTAVALAALTMAAALSACSGSFLEARPVCLAPHGGANVQLAPSAQCEAGLAGYAWVNGQSRQIAAKTE